ncbi:MAG: methyltransferase domain-containing protein [Phycisphaerae bacterium]|nr:MAG: methyltransferase domain-containing protein [Planctomycetota bacterium]KAB2949558.1 MAG: class I SAM-dependent methyltransferase [Phycisphaerae bacterium]MBE7455838.1 methyltransferase domain-containing protein [Planctomycetia bacterium]MCK6463473.1 class I SAM-dependent methyltransferase [Phycisphaerae bacterium]MCL4717096.1 methyltransferase domain-containing protein [Phycisphaerae bacterium]
MLTLPPSHATPAIKPTKPEIEGESARRSLLPAFLHAYWLRPENAFWMTLRSLALGNAPRGVPSIDVCCGDGVFSFIDAGGRFHPDFDVFRAVTALEHVTRSHADMFDAETENYAPPIDARPPATISIGTDLKPNLLRKAAALGFYDRLIRHDGNTPLPLPDGVFRRTYCNSAYWMTQVDGFLRELRRVTRPDGVVILHVKLADMRRYTLDRFERVLGGEFLRIIGRGRLDCWSSLASRQTWERRFNDAGLSIERCDVLATRTHAHLWDVGLRPIAPLLVRMTSALTPETRAAIKRDWVALFLDLLDPITRPDFDAFDKADEPAELQYVLRPRG